MIASDFVSQHELAIILGILPRTLRELDRKGHVPRDRATGRYPLAKSVQAYVAYRVGGGLSDAEALDYHRERARLTKHQADRAQLRYDRERNKLVEADAAQLALEHVLVPIRAYFLEQGARLAPVLAGRQPIEVKEALDRENQRELRRLAKPQLEFGGPGEDPELDGVQALDDDPDHPESGPGSGDLPGAPEP